MIKFYFLSVVCGFLSKRNLKNISNFSFPLKNKIEANIIFYVEKLMKNN